MGRPEFGRWVAGPGEQRLGLGRVAEAQVRPAQPVLQPGYDQGVADRIPVQGGGRRVQPVPEDRPQRPPFLRVRLGVQVREQRAEDVDPLLELDEAQLGRLPGHPFPLGPVGLGPPGPVGADEPIVVPMMPPRSRYH